MDKTKELLKDVIINGKVVYFDLEITNADIIDMTHDKVMYELAIIASKETLTNTDKTRIEELRNVSDLIMTKTGQLPDPEVMLSWDDLDGEQLDDWLEFQALYVDSSTLHAKDYLTEKDGKYFVQTYKLRA